MIKLIAFDLIGVLAFESDEEYLNDAYNIINKDNNTIENITKDIINKLYYIKDKFIFTKLNKEYPNIKLIIATNHVSYVIEFINNSFDTTHIDDIIISANIHKIKPNSNFYIHILNKYNIKPNELLFLDDNINNIKGANSLGINTIKIEKNIDLYKIVKDYLN